HAVRGAVHRRDRRRRADPLQDEPDPGHQARGRRTAALPGGAVRQRPLDDQRSAALYVKVLGSYPAKALRPRPRPGGLPGPQAGESPAETLEAVAADEVPALRRPRQYKLVDRAARQPDTVVRVGDTLIGGDGFVVMDGPCSVESDEQI